MNTLHYFGTNTRSAGHYFWDFDSTGQYLHSSSTYFKDIPFNPEGFNKTAGSRYNSYNFKEKGNCEYHQKDGYSIIAISGSHVDSRGGCHSVFWVKEDLTQEQMIQKIKMTPAAFEIIKKMPFDVEFFKNDINQLG